MTYSALCISKVLGGVWIGKMWSKDCALNPLEVGDWLMDFTLHPEEGESEEPRGG